MKPEQLFPREKECLRLLAFPMRPAEIAQSMGITVNTVNGYLQSARRKLGVTDSMKAAIMLREAETPSRNEGVNFSGLAPAPERPHTKEASASCEAERAGENWEIPFANKGRPWNDLDLRWRITWPAALFFLVAMGVSAVSSGAASLSTAYLSFSR
ncbi:response regulator transcription factor [Sphingomonas bisphenolicum]